MVQLLPDPTANERAWWEASKGGGARGLGARHHLAFQRRKLGQSCDSVSASSLSNENEETHSVSTGFK